jgi:hypothetical protein
MTPALGLLMLVTIAYMSVLDDALYPELAQ